MNQQRKKDQRKSLRSELFSRFSEEGVDIPTAVKGLRKILNQNQPEFAQAVGISLSALRRIEQDDRRYNMVTLLKILEKFDLEPVIKLGGKSHPPRTP